MLGAVAGDIIGSPFDWNNTDDMYFELCRSTRGFFRGREVSSHPKATLGSVMTLAVARWLSLDESRSPYRLAAIMQEEGKAHPEVGCSTGFRRWLDSDSPRATDSPRFDAAVRVSPVAIAVKDLPEALNLARVAASVTTTNEEAICGAQAVCQAVWMARNGRNKDDIRFSLEHDFGYDLSRGAAELRPLLQGFVQEPVVVNGEETGAFYLRETGKADTSAALAVTAAMTAFLQSDDFEGAVRKAVSMGGWSSAVASICGAVAEPFYGGVPEKINGLCSGYLPSELRIRMESFERLAAGKNIRTGKVEKRQDDSFKAIHVEGRPPMFVVSAYRKELIDVLRERFGERMTIVKPSEYTVLMKELRTEQKEGTFIEEHRPDVRTLYFQDGEVRSPSTYEGKGLASKEERKASLISFWEICDYAQEVKKTLQRMCGYTGEGSVHFESAYYPVIGHDCVEIMQGDLLAGAVSIDPRSGLIKVTADGDYSDGEYRQADWCRERVFPNYSTLDTNAIKQCIGRFCLDEGVGIDDLDRVSNVETANRDMSKTRDKVLLDSMDMAKTSSIKR